jgi:hypothetical protein
MTSTHDADARSGFAGIQALLNREPGYSVAKECLVKQAAAEERDPSLRSDRGVRLHPDAWSWYVGALGEIEVGAILSQLGPEWFVRHAVPIGTGATDVDHLVIGPNGIFVLNTKRHIGANIWVGDRVMRVNGSNVPHLRAARSEASNVCTRLGDRVGFPVVVYSAIITVGERSLKDARNTLARSTSVVSSTQLIRWILSRPATLSPTALELVRLAAEEPDTWHIDPHAADTLRVMPRFQRLRDQVGDNPPSPQSLANPGRPTQPARRPSARPTRPSRRPVSAPRAQGRARSGGRRPESRFERVVKALVVGLFLVPTLFVIGIVLLWEVFALALGSH